MEISHTLDTLKWKWCVNVTLRLHTHKHTISRYNPIYCHPPPTTINTSQRVGTVYQPEPISRTILSLHCPTIQYSYIYLIPQTARCPFFPLFSVNPMQTTTIIMRIFLETDYFVGTVGVTHCPHCPYLSLETNRTPSKSIQIVKLVYNIIIQVLIAREVCPA